MYGQSKSALWFEIKILKPLSDSVFSDTNYQEQDLF